MRKTSWGHFLFFGMYRAIFKFQFMVLFDVQRTLKRSTSSRTSDRCHWCGDPLWRRGAVFCPKTKVVAEKTNDFFHEKSRKIRGIATPVCALARNDTFFFTAVISPTNINSPWRYAEKYDKIFKTYATKLRKR